MFPDGICRVTDSYYTKTVQFQDINYQLNQNEDKTAIFDGWCDFLNYFDSSVRFQLSFVNMSANKDNYARYITISPQGDDFDSIRLEYTQMLQNHHHDRIDPRKAQNSQHSCPDAVNGTTAFLHYCCTSLDLVSFSCRLEMAITRMQNSTALA